MRRRYRSNYSTWTLSRVAVNALVLSLLALGWMMLGCHPKGSSPKPKPLTAIEVLRHVEYRYPEINLMWFNGKLPAETTFSITPNTDFQAQTVKRGDYFTIQFNPRYNQALSQVELNMMHESCHIVTWEETLDHGFKWISCMRDLASRGAFDHLW